ncbi:MAG TPA: Calx-beta domain-containing protein, partial [Vicinamibacteria bacterium]|nr:Calx-beta domain-containing protein [Vicinamibacteria bacterium]
MLQRRSVAILLLYTFGVDTVLFGGARPVAQAAPVEDASGLPPAPSASASSTPAQCEAALRDGLAPRLGVARSQLWPPYHQHVDVGLSVDLTEACEGHAALRLEVWSEEPDEDPNADGAFPGDARVEFPALFLRAERKGDADGRVYLVIGTATGPDGVEGSSCTAIGVPQSRSRADLASLDAQVQAALSHCDVNGTPPAGFVKLVEAPFGGDANAVPLVDAGSDQAVDFPGPAILSGSVSDDGVPSGTLFVNWSVISGPGSVVFSSPTSPSTSATLDAVGTYVLRLTASDSQLSASDDVVVVVAQENQAPVVDAGPDLHVTLPQALVTLQGSVSDDGRPNGTLTVTWSADSGPGPVDFVDAGSPVTQATLQAAGEYVLRLTASDSQFIASDTVRVVVDTEDRPVISAYDARVQEGHDGTQGALVALALSKPWPRPVFVDYMTFDGTAAAGCDYRTRYGTIEIAPGQTVAEVLVPVIGDVAPEPDETVVVRLGNPVEAQLAREQVALTIGNDDSTNQPPAPAGSPAPPDDAQAVALPPTLSWSASDPDGDAVVSDLYLGPAFGTDGQSWARSCPATAEPSPRAAAATGYDEANDRLMVVGGRGASAGTLWVLANASGTGGDPAWQALAVSGGPAHVERAATAYDTATNRLVVHGGCVAPGCSSASGATWILTNANGLGGAPQWLALDPATPGPALMGALAGHDPARDSLILFAGAADSDGATSDVWLLEHASGTTGTPSWRRLPIDGSIPAPRWGAAGGYDPVTDRLLVFGGRGDGGAALGDTWILANASGRSGVPVWKGLDADAGGPPPRWGASAAFDAGSRRLLLFGGSTAGIESGFNFVFADAWLLTGSNDRADWVRVATPVGGPVGRFEASAAYATGANRLILALGANNKVGDPADLWLLAGAAGALPLHAGDLTAMTLNAEDLVPGDGYAWKVVTRDGHGAWRGSPIWRFTSNGAPLVDAGPDATVRVTASATLAGTVTDDGWPMGGALTTSWEVVAGPGTVAFADPASPVTTATFSESGTYSLRLVASDSALEATDTLAVQVLPGNAAPQVDAGPDQAIMSPLDSVILAASVTDDGVPEGAVINASWGLVSGPATVSFSDPASLTTTAQFSQPGSYVLRLTATDTELVGQDDVLILVYPPNQAPVVSAGPDVTTDLGTFPLLDGSVSDDGLPPGSSPVVAWSVDSGPGPVHFANSAAPKTTASFEVSGTHVLRLTASDGLASASSTVTVTVREAKLIPYASGEYRYQIVPYRSEGGGFEQPGFDDSAFSIGVAPFGKDNNNCQTRPNTVWPIINDLLVRKSFTLTSTASDLTVGVSIDNDVRVFVNGVDISNGFRATGGCGFRDKIVLRAPSAILVQGENLLAVHARDHGGSSDLDVEVRTARVAPGNQPPVVDAGPDRTAVWPTTITLTGAIHDDGLPSGRLNASWGQVEDGAPQVSFIDPDGATASFYFPEPGRYTLRLTANDSELEGQDDVVIDVEAPNQAPVVSAGPDLTVSLPNAAALNGSASDDGLPQGSALQATWTKLSGPGSVAFGSPALPATTATFTVAGTYVLRLTATDGEQTTSDDATIVVKVAVNQAPIVSAGPDLTVPVSAGATLAGNVTDDGLPAGKIVTALWSKVSGPGSVRFADISQPSTTTTFGAAGVYVLRLTANDSALTTRDDVTIQVTGAGGNRAPVVDAGPDQATTLPANTLSLDATVSDDGLPSGATLTAAWSVVSAPGPVTFTDPAAVDTTVSVSAPGTYVLELVVSDSEIRSSDTVAIIANPGTASGTAPVVSLSSPADGSAITDRSPVIGSVSGASLAAWTLEHRRAGTEAWTRFAEGTVPASNSTLGVFDPTLLVNGPYEIRLKATDVAGRSAQASTTVIVKDNLKVGHFTVSFVDLEVPVAGVPVRLTRTYDSRDRSKGDFGHGWRLDVSSLRVAENRTPGLSWQGTKSSGAFPTYCLPATTPHVVTVAEPGGRVHEFEMSLSPQCQPFVPIDQAQVTFTPRPGTLGTLRALGASASVWVVGSWPGSIELYDADTFDLYDPSAYEYTSPDGRRFQLREGKGLERLVDPNGNVLTITANGISHSSGKAIAFARDPEGRITSVTDPAGNRMAYGYDGDGDLAAYTDREGASTTFTYRADLPHHLQDILDPLGRRPIRNEYYPDGRIKSHTDAFGKTIEYDHQIGTRQEVVTDRNGAVRVLEYDQRGNVVKETQPDGRVVRRSFDLRNNRLSETEPHEPSNPSPALSLYTYDAADNLLTARDPEGNTTEYTYNTRQQVLTTKDARGRLTVNAYDAKGNLLTTKSGGASATGPFLSETTSSYDARGNLKTQTVVVDGIAQITTYEYDGFGNLTKETDALGHATAYSYDGSGNRLTQTTTRTLPSGGSDTPLTQYEYDKNGRLVKTTDPDGSFTRTVYDVLGRQVESHDKLGRSTDFEYDEMGRLVRTTYPDQTFEESTYDSEGRRLTSRDRGGRTTSYEYDALGRLKKTTHPDGTFTESSYDAAGRLVATTDARGKTTHYEYDSAGRRTKVRDPLGNETAFTYDANGNQRTVRDARLNTTSFEYDDLNRRTRTIFPDATYTETSYDSLGRRISERDQAGLVTRFEYDKVGRLVKVIDALGQETVYGYDELGNRTLQRDANGHETRFEYDRLGRETARILPDGARETKAYDPAGNLETRTDFMGRSTRYAYDLTNRLVSRSYPNAAENVTLTYTASGRRETVTDTRGTTTYGYDLRDRLTSLVQPGVGSLSFAYDGNGNRTSLTATVGSGSHVTSYGYDDASRLDVVTDPLGRDYDFGHDANGNRSSLAFPNGTTTAYSYDALNRLTNLTTTGPLGTVQGYAFTLGPSGNRTRIDEADGSVREYGYDALYRLT